MPRAVEGAVVIDYPQFANVAPEIDKVILRHLNEYGAYLVQWIRSNSPKDTSAASESVTYEVENVSNRAFVLTVGSGVPYAGWALEWGRGPGKRPPLEKILGWVNRREIASRQPGGLLPADTKGRIRTVGRRVGRSYAARVYSPGTVVGRKRGLSKIDSQIDRVTKEFSFTTRQKVNEAFLVARLIGRQGVRAPRLISRAFEDTAVLRDRIATEITNECIELIYAVSAKEAALHNLFG